MSQPPPQPQPGPYHAHGALVRPPDPRETKYALRRTLAPRAVDLSAPRILAEPVPVRSQGMLGACAAFAAETAAQLARAHAGARAEPLHAGWLYHHARVLRGWEGRDTGSYPADTLDILCQGAPAAGEAPYVEDPAWLPPGDLEAAPRLDYVLSHRPFYPSEGGVLDAFWSALDAGMPVVVASWWPGEWFAPVRGVIPAGVAVPAHPTGGHAWMVCGIVPGYLVAQNSWGEGWTPDAAENGVPGAAGLRPGQFLVPWEYATGGMIWECRAVALEPAPVPAARRVYVQVWTAAAAGGWEITATEQALPEAGGWVTVKARRGDEPEAVIAPFTYVEG